MARVQWSPQARSNMDHLLWLAGLLDKAEGKPRAQSSRFYGEGFDAVSNGYVTLADTPFRTAADQVRDMIARERKRKR